MGRGTRNDDTIRVFNPSLVRPVRVEIIAVDRSARSTIVSNVGELSVPSSAAWERWEVFLPVACCVPKEILGAPDCRCI